MIDDWSLIGELATKMDTMDLSQGFKGFRPWVEKCSDIRGWIKIKTIVQEPAMDPLLQDSIEETCCASMKEFGQIFSWVSSGYWWKDVRLFVFDRWGFMTLGKG